MIAIIVNRVREDLGLEVAGLTFVPALVIYGLAWLGVSSTMLPRATRDPGALLPGSLLVALTITVMHAISEFYLPDRLDRASQLYGAIGTTIVTLGWFFILGRAIVLAMELNAAIYERYGSISQVVFSLPFFRVLARKSARGAQVLRTPVARCPFRGLRELQFQAAAAAACSGSHGLPGVVAQPTAQRVPGTAAAVQIGLGISAVA